MFAPGMSDNRIAPDVDCNPGQKAPQTTELHLLHEPRCNGYYVGGGTETLIALSWKRNMHGVRQIKNERSLLRSCDSSEKNFKPWKTVKLREATTNDVAVKRARPNPENLKDAPDRNQNRFEGAPDQAGEWAAVPQRILPAVPKPPWQERKILERDSVVFDNSAIDVGLMVRRAGFFSLGSEIGELLQR
jgi:hypothetical protein